jgi:hypothetical protein
MSVQIFYKRAIPAGTAPRIKFYLCDSITDRPTLGMVSGEMAITKDTQSIYIASSDTTWVEKAGGGVSIAEVKADTDIASSITLKHSNTNDHASGSDNQDLSGKADIGHNHASSYATTGHTHSGVDTRGYAALANGTTTMALATNRTVKVIPTATATFTTTVASASLTAQVIVQTSGTTSRVITFGTGFKAVGTLATGTTTNRQFVVSFVSDGTNMIETGRTAAMAI